MSTIWYFYVAVLCDEWFGAGITRICLGKFPSPQIGLNTGDQQQSSEPKSTKKNDIDVVACFSSYLFIVFLLLVPTSLQCFTQRCAPNRVKRHIHSVEDHESARHHGGLSLWPILGCVGCLEDDIMAADGWMVCWKNCLQKCGQKEAIKCKYIFIYNIYIL